MQYANAYHIVEQAIRYIVSSYKNQPSLEEIALKMNISPFHLQRTFTEWAGISPKKFVQYLTLESLKQEVNQTENLSSAAEKVGLSSQSRVYDLFVTLEAVTPGEYKLKGQGMIINYGIHPSPFGDCFLAVTSRGVCAMSFIGKSIEEEVKHLQNQWPNALVRHHEELTGPIVNRIFWNQENVKPLHVLVKGTDFQVKVWEALLKIPFGSVMSYHQVASSAGMAKATRAVGTAIANNAVAYLIPCHRVIRNEGVIGNYRWDPSRKAAMIGWEKALTHT